MDYCEQSRGNELILVGMLDDLYASALPLPKLRYGLMASSAAAGRYSMPFDEMGVILTAAQFNDLPRLEPLFRDRLRGWGLDSSEPIGTVIFISSRAVLEELIRAHPDSDFLIPARLGPLPPADRQVIACEDHLLMLSPRALRRAAPPRWPSRL